MQFLHGWAETRRRVDWCLRWTIRLVGLMVLHGVVAGATSAQAATYYVTTTGSDSSSCAAAQSKASARKTIQSGLGCLTAGDILIIGSGTYAGSTNALSGLPNGTASAYITIKAEIDGTVILTGGLNMSSTNAYLAFQGLRIQDTGGRNILGHHLKFQRMEFKGGCSTGNCTNITVGSNDVSNTADILVEDSWVHGTGGRYNLIIYNADRVVVRRVVIRHDGGWSDGGSADPEAGLQFYNSANCAAQNVVVIDSTLKYSTWAGSFYSVQNSSVNHAVHDNSWTGVIALGGSDLGLRADGTMTNVTVSNSVFWDTANGGISFGTGSVGATVDGVVIGRSNVASAGDFKGGIGGWGGGTKTIRNVILTGWTTSPDLIGVSATYFDTYNNSSASTGTGRVTYSPFTNGLKYLPRIESGMALATAGSGGATIGATIVNQIGTTGTLYGEAGWNTVTATSLWPWPNQDRIKKEMCTDAGVTRGFCAGTTSLTDYIFNYLGNGGYPGGGGGSVPVPGPPSAVILQ